jgi:hypothetical protein
MRCFEASTSTWALVRRPTSILLEYATVFRVNKCQQACSEYLAKAWPFRLDVSIPWIFMPPVYSGSAFSTVVLIDTIDSTTAVGTFVSSL